MIKKMRRIHCVHFVGIGGSGMSGIAEVMLSLGYQVQGSDLKNNASVQRLKNLGATVVIGHDEKNICGADAIVVSSAVDESNPEVAAAREQLLPIVQRAEMLAELMRFRYSIAVAGTHGKTTTTSLVASVLAEGGLDPTFVIGGRLKSADANARLGQGDYLVAEADESDASFVHLKPMLAIVTNIDADHMDTYGHDFGRLRQAFLEFVEHLPFYGTAVLCIDDDNVRSLLPIITKPVTTYGLSEAAHVRAVDVKHCGGQRQFRVTRRGSRGDAKLSDLAITLNMPGEHNVRNALAAIAVAMELAVPDDAIVRAFAGFRGVERRFQRCGEISLDGGNSFTLVDDYGHHPAEMESTIEAAQGAFPGRRLVLVFQPHRYTRTRDCFEDFVRVLSSVDALLLTEVYAAGETPIVAADGRALVRAVRVAGKVEPIFVEDVADVPAAIMKMAQPEDVVMTMGAGSIGTVPAALVKH